MYSYTVFLFINYFIPNIFVVNLNHSYTTSESPSLKTTQLYEEKWKFSQDIHYLIQYLRSHFHHLLLKWWHITPSWICLKKSVCLRIVYSFHLLPPSTFWQDTQYFLWIIEKYFAMPVTADGYVNLFKFLIRKTKETEKMNKTFTVLGVWIETDLCYILSFWLK